MPGIPYSQHDLMNPITFLDISLPSRLTDISIRGSQSMAAKSGFAQSPALAQPILTQPSSQRHF